jgi:hypothetical protein
MINLRLDGEGEEHFRRVWALFAYMHPGANVLEFIEMAVTFGGSFLAIASAKEEQTLAELRDAMRREQEDIAMTLPERKKDA